ncbi:DUF1642 domain-containing protein [Enterococcus lactis]|uniref:DUF1642 domain-containing protein n=1 Tax=Enterococcus lactis TaxID=357441 RepID=UPI0024145C20|nr:DUF1642 domain-containing protein [Enterococcus lactis]MDG4569074.1 DUF1642 domain-containing protein [Enterococcus lactis]
MNKQEQKNKSWALKWIDKEIEENERHAHQKTGAEANTAYWKGYIASCKNIRYIVKELDEPQKPVVPKFVADYIEEYRGGGATLYEMMDSSEDEVYTWLFGNPRIETENERQLLFAQAYAVGYEVEKEPLYTVTISLDRKYYLATDENECDGISPTLTTSSDVLGYRYYLTEKEIKSADNNLWKIAVPVEEVVER